MFLSENYQKIAFFCRKMPFILVFGHILAIYQHFSGPQSKNMHHRAHLRFIDLD